MAKKEDRIELRIDKATKQKLKKLADKESRSMSNYLVFLINYEYEKLKKGKI